MSATQRIRIAQIEHEITNIEAQRIAFEQLADEFENQPKIKKGNDLGLRAVQILTDQVEPQLLEPDNKIIRPMVFRATPRGDTPTLYGFIEGVVTHGENNKLKVPKLDFDELNDRPLRWVVNESNDSHMDVSIFDPEHKEHAEMLDIYPQIPSSIGKIAVFQLVKPGVEPLFQI